MDRPADYITVGIIARNEEHTIAHTIRHLARQEYPHGLIEIVIVDGNSTDKTREIAKQALEEAKLTYTIINEGDFDNPHGVNYGHSRARNLVIRHASAKSKYIARIDADCRATPNRLSELHQKIAATADPEVAGAGGTRLVETQNDDISTTELVLNYYFTSRIMSLGNPAFVKRPQLTYTPSIAGYNSIYYKTILEDNLYDTTYPFNTDDIELNYRLRKSGYKFLYAPDAEIYHRGEPILRGFARQMYMYGTGVAHTMRLHQSYDVRLYIYLALAFVGYVLLTLPLLCLSISSRGAYRWLPFAPYGLLLLLGLVVFIENFSKTKSWHSVLVFWTIPVHIWSYAWGWLRTYWKKS